MEIMTFEEWMLKNHPEKLDEDWRQWAKKAALGGALLGAGMGLGKMSGTSDSPISQPTIQQQSAQTNVTYQPSEKPQWMKDYGNPSISDQEYVDKHVLGAEGPIESMKSSVESMRSQLIQNGISPEVVNRMSPVHMKQLLQHQQRLLQYRQRKNAE